MRAMFPITKGSVKLLCWPMRKAVRPWKIIREAYKKGNKKQGSHAEDHLPHSL